MGLQDYTYRLMAQSGDTTAHDELAVSGDLSGSPTLQSNGGSDYAWRWSSAAGTVTGPSKAIAAETTGGGITVAFRLKIVTASSTAGAFYAAYKTDDANPYGLGGARHSGTEIKGRYRTGAGITDTSANYTHGSGFITYVMKLDCVDTAGSNDQIQVWRSDGSGTTTPDMTSALFNAGNITVARISVGVSDATVEVSDFVTWAEELTDQECADLAVNGIRATLDSAGETLTAEHGTITFSGQSISYKLSSELGTSTVTFVGQDVSFTYQQPGVYTVELEPGILAFSAPESYGGIGALLEPALLSFTGKNVNFRWSGDPVVTARQTSISIANKIGL